jgi:hypothetical protein
MRNLKRSKGNGNENIQKNFYVFDTETTCLEPMPKNFVFGVIYGYYGHNLQFRVIHSVEDFITEFEKDIYKGKYIFAHNAEFDLLTIFGNIIKNIDRSAVFNGKFITANYKGIKFGDSMNIYATSVQKIGEMLGSEKIINTKVKSEGLTKNNLTKEDIEYCKQDCKIVYNALLEIFETIGDIRLTLASLSMYEYRTHYLPENIMFTELVDEFYESYYGGRTEAFHIGKVNASVYDINSMYSKAMLDCVFPDIKNLKKETHVDVSYLQFLMRGYEGLAKVTVRHKDTYFGFLPVKMEVGKSIKLVFPVGVFETIVNFNELSFAISKGVVEILKVHYVVYGKPIKTPFKEFINDNYKKKVEATNKLKATIHKNIMNSLYGRFAMRMKMSCTYYDDVPFQLIQELQDDDKKYELKLFSKEREDCYLITENEKMKNSFFSIPVYSSYITSHARIILLKGLLANENNDVCYCDTDSIFLGGDFSGNVSDLVGDFKKEDKHIIEIRGLKNYSHIDNEGKIINVIKGISRGSKEKKGTRVPTYETKKYYKTKQAIEQNKEAGSAYIMVKTLTHEYDKRIVLSDGSTRPLKLTLKGYE